MRRAPVLRMPWASGPRPVATVVHTMAGTRSGSARSRPLALPARSAPSRGISPRASICSVMRRSRPSMPTTRSRTPVGTTAKSGGVSASPRPRSDAAAKKPAKRTAAATSTGRSCWRDAAAAGRRAPRPPATSTATAARAPKRPRARQRPTPTRRAAAWTDEGRSGHVGAQPEAEIEEAGHGQEQAQVAREVRARAAWSDVAAARTATRPARKARRATATAAAAIR